VGERWEMLIVFPFPLINSYYLFHAETGEEDVFVARFHQGAELPEAVKWEGREGGREGRREGRRDSNFSHTWMTR